MAAQSSFSGLYEMYTKSVEQALKSPLVTSIEQEYKDRLDLYVDQELNSIKALLDITAYNFKAGLTANLAEAMELSAKVTEDSIRCKLGSTLLGVTTINYTKQYNHTFEEDLKLVIEPIEILISNMQIEDLHDVKSLRLIEMATTNLDKYVAKYPQFESQALIVKKKLSKKINTLKFPNVYHE